MLRTVKRSVMRIIVLPVGRCRFLEENESGLWFRRNKIWRFTECRTPYNGPSDYDCDKSPSSWNLAMSIFVDRGKLENPEKISSEQGREPTTLKCKALMILGPRFDPGHIGARQTLSPLRHHNLVHDLSQNMRLAI